MYIPCLGLLNEVAYFCLNKKRKFWKVMLNEESFYAF
jgi:hypothetical protein